MFALELPLWLWGMHALLLIVVIYTDLTRRKVYLPWSGIALLVSGITALWATYPLFHLIIGGLGFAWGVYGLHKEQWAGGDVWMLTYICLSFGMNVVLIVSLGITLLLLGVLIGRLRWGQTIPLAAVWGLAAVFVLVAGLLMSVSPDLFIGAASSASQWVAATPSSPLPTPTPLPDAVIIHAQQAADAVAQVGMVAADQRPAQAQRAAETLRTLAQTTPLPQHAGLLSGWAEALEEYAAGDPGALGTIKQFSQINHPYRKGVLPDAYE
jgi:hypothetical protein